jgi:hypothetical protein
MLGSKPSSNETLPSPSTHPPLEEPAVVGWDGPDDPMHPMNWPRKQKIACTTTIALITILTYEPLSSHERLFYYYYFFFLSAEFHVALTETQPPWLINDRAERLSNHTRLPFQQ